MIVMAWENQGDDVVIVQATIKSRKRRLINISSPSHNEEILCTQLLDGLADHVDRVSTELNAEEVHSVTEVKKDSR